MGFRGFMGFIMAKLQDTTRDMDERGLNWMKPYWSTCLGMHEEDTDSGFGRCTQQQEQWNRECGEGGSYLPSCGHQHLPSHDGWSHASSQGIVSSYSYRHQTPFSSISSYASTDRSLVAQSVLSRTDLLPETSFHVEARLLLG